MNFQLFVEAQTSLLREMSRQVEEKSGRIDPILIQMRSRVYTITKENKQRIEDARDHVFAMTSVLRSMTDRMSDSEMFFIDYCTLMRIMDRMMVAITSDQVYYLPTDVRDLLEETRKAKAKQMLNRFSPERIVTKFIHDNSPQVVKQLGKSYPMPFLEHLHQNKIELTERVRTLTKDYARKYKTDPKALEQWIEAIK